MSISDVLDQEFNTASADDLMQCDDIAKALEIVSKENPYSKLPPKKEIKAEELFPAKTNEVIPYKSPDEMTIPELLEEQHLDEVANEAEEMFQQLSVQALNSSPKCMAELANAAMAFLKMKQDSILAKADNRLKREKLQLEKLKLEMKTVKKDDSDSLQIETLPEIKEIED